MRFTSKILIVFFISALSAISSFGQDVDSSRIFINPEVEAQFPGGEDSLIKFLVNNLRYPTCGSTVAGCVYVAFIVDSFGGVGEPCVLKGLEFHFDREALEFVRKMPKWKPAMLFGRAVKTEYVLPICYE